MITVILMMVGYFPASGQDTDEVSPKVRAFWDRFQLWNECAPVVLALAVSTEAESIGLTSERLQTTVASRLRGSRIYTDSPLESLGSFLYVQVGVGGSSFTIQLRFSQLLYKEADVLAVFREIMEATERLRGPSSLTTESMTAEEATRIREHVFKLNLSPHKQSAYTWETATFGTHTGNAMSILQNVTEHTDKFINEYLRVNAEVCD